MSTKKIQYDLDAVLGQLQFMGLPCIGAYYSILNHQLLYGRVSKRDIENICGDSFKAFWPMLSGVLEEDLTGYYIAWAHQKGKKPKIKVELQYPSFDAFWSAYNKKKGNKTKCLHLWSALANDEREKILENARDYHNSFNDPQYQPLPETFLNQRRWENEDEWNFKKKTTNPDAESFLKMDKKFLMFVLSNGYAVGTTNGYKWASPTAQSEAIEDYQLFQ